MNIDIKLRGLGALKVDWVTDDRSHSLADPSIKVISLEESTQAGKCLLTNSIPASALCSPMVEVVYWLRG